MKTHEFSKYEIATYLRDINRVLLYSMGNETTSFFELFKQYMYNENRIQYATLDYYFEMISIYELLLMSKHLTMIYDNYFEFLNDAKIDEFSIPNDIFIDSNDRNRFSKKQIIKFIRNALNHNDNPEHDLIKFIRDYEEGKEVIKLEILLKKTKPVPFHVIIDIKQLMRMTFEIFNSNSIKMITYRSKKPIYLTSDNCNDTLNNIFYRRYFVRNKISDEQKEKTFTLLKKYGDTRNIEDSLIRNGFDFKDHELSLAQKIKIQEDLMYWESLGVKGNDVLMHLVKKVIPLSFCKERVFVTNLCLANCYMRRIDSSLYDMVKDAKEAYINNSTSKTSPISIYIDIIGLNKDLLYDVTDYDNIVSLSSAIYYGYLFDTLVTDDKIRINDNKIYDRERIRNSFVHMRWFKGAKEGFRLFDWDNGIDNELNNNSDGFWKGSIKAVDMDLCAEHYLKSKLSEVDNKNYIGIPIHVRENKANGIIYISCNKNGKRYTVLLTNGNYKNVLYVIDDTQEEKIASKRDIEVFIEELENLTDYEKEKYEIFITNLKNSLLNQLQELDNDQQTRRI